MNELYKLVAAKFLTDARFTVQVQTPIEYQDSRHTLPKEVMQEMLRRDMLQRVSSEMVKRFEKEIKVEPVRPEQFQGERHSLEFMAFTMPEFKHIVEFMIAEMPLSEIQRIRSSKIEQ